MNDNRNDGPNAIGQTLNDPGPVRPGVIAYAAIIDYVGRRCATHEVTDEEIIREARAAVNGIKTWLDTANPCRLVRDVRQSMRTLEQGLAEMRCAVDGCANPAAWHVGVATTAADTRQLLCDEHTQVRAALGYDPETDTGCVEVRAISPARTDQ